MEIDFEVKQVDSKSGSREREFLLVAPGLAITAVMPAQELLEGAVAKWAFILSWLKAHPGEILIDGGFGTCPLCRRYLREGCLGCPVAAGPGAGCGGCYNTPYDNWRRAIALSDPHGQLIAARKELQFLRQLFLRTGSQRQG